MTLNCYKFEFSENFAGFSRSCYGALEIVGVIIIIIIGRQQVQNE